MNQFLPESYKVPASASGFLKFEDGDNRIRILSRPMLGYSLWIGGKPKRVKTVEEFTENDIKNADENSYTGKKGTPNHFWAIIVWNYKEARIQILEVTQSSIQRGIVSLTDDTDWGTPLNYDLNIARHEENKITRYSVTPKPKKEIAPDVKQALKDTPIDLEALFYDADPYAKPAKAKAPMNENVKE